MVQRFKNKIPFVVLAGLLAAAFFVWQGVWAQPQSEKIKIDFFDVGQGSAILVSAPNGNQVLIDGGPSDAVLEKLGQALPFNDRNIELIVLTHPDADHLNGLVEVLKRYQVEKILETGILDSSGGYAVWNDLIKQKGIAVVFAQAGQSIKLADNLEIEILYPLALINGEDYKDNTNNTSIVGKIIYGENSLLFTGDAEAAAENVLRRSGQNLDSDILGVGHHGSKNASTPEFLSAVMPEISVIQVGAKNRYGHPAPETLERLKTTQIYRTDKDGDVEFECDLKECIRF